MSLFFSTSAIPLTVMTLALTLTTSILPTTALANDGGMAYVDVQGINPVTTINGKKITVEPDSTIKFYGKDAERFMQLLPVVANAQDAGLNPADRALRKANDRGLGIVSNGWNLLMSCNGLAWTSGPNNQPSVSKAPQVECQVSLHKVADPTSKYDMLGDSFKLDVNDKNQMTCQ